MSRVRNSVVPALLHGRERMLMKISTCSSPLPEGRRYFMSSFTQSVHITHLCLSPRCPIEHYVSLSQSLMHADICSDIIHANLSGNIVSMCMFNSSIS